MRSSLEERDALLSSLSLELCRREKDEGHEWQDAGSVKTFASIPVFYNGTQCECSHTHTHNHWPCWIKRCSRHHSRSSANTEDEWESVPVHATCAVTGFLHTSLSLCLCFFFFFDFLCESEEEPLERGTERGRTRRVRTRHLDKSILVSKSDYCLCQEKNHTATLWIVAEAAGYGQLSLWLFWHMTHY